MRKMYLDKHVPDVPPLVKARLKMLLNSSEQKRFCKVEKKLREPLLKDTAYRPLPRFLQAFQNREYYLLRVQYA